MPLTAVILAAGFGTRLRPLSFQVPKPLFPILNRPLLSLILSQLQDAGFRRVAVNVHHLADEIKLFLKTQNQWDLEILVSFEAEILGTGGGLRRLVDFVGKSPFLVINGDILTDLNFADIFQQHRPDALSTMVLHDCPRFNNVWLAENGHVAAFGSPPAEHLPSSPLAFTGVQVVSPRIFELIPPERFVSIIDTYRQAISAGKSVAAAVIENFYWQDIGTPKDYLAIHHQLLHHELPSLTAFFPPITDPFLGQEVSLGTGSNLAGGVCLGKGVKVGAAACLKDTVVWDDAVIDPGVFLEGCVIGRRVHITESARGGCFQT